jgi:hypothetical protein
MDDTSSDGDWFGDDFGQKIDLTVRIREILRNYPEVKIDLSNYLLD